MHDDPIVAEVRRARQDYARKFGYNLDAIVDDLRRKERNHPERLVSFAPKPLRRRKTA